MLCLVSAFLEGGNLSVLAAPRALVQGVSFSKGRSALRVTITLSQKVPYRSFLVPADPGRGLPLRLVFDFSPASLASRARLPVLAREGFLLRIRTGQFNPTTARVVLDLKRLPPYRVSVLHRPFRIIVDFEEKKALLSLGPTPKSQEHLERPSFAPLPNFRYRVVLDPGHGGHDPGASSVDGVQEKEVTLAIARRLAAKLKKRLPAEVFLTRSRDVFVPLEERTALANRVEADLFVSIHANASTNRSLQGIETYYLNNTGDRATLRLAAMENGLGAVSRAGRGKGKDLSYILSDLIQTGKEEESSVLARRVHEAMIQRLRGKYPKVKSLGVKKGPFYVLVGAHMPCILAETGFLTHRVEGKRLAQPVYQEEIAEGLFWGIARFLQENRLARGL